LASAVAAYQEGEGGGGRDGYPTLFMHEHV